MGTKILSYPLLLRRQEIQVFIFLTTKVQYCLNLISFHFFIFNFCFISCILKQAWHSFQRLIHQNNHFISDLNSFTTTFLFVT